MLANLNGWVTLAVRSDGGSTAQVELVHPDGSTSYHWMPDTALAATCSGSSGNTYSVHLQLASTGIYEWRVMVDGTQSEWVFGPVSTDSSNPPVVTSASPNLVAEGKMMQVYLQGSNFGEDGPVYATINGVECNADHQSSTSIKCKMWTGFTGTFAVTLLTQETGRAVTYLDFVEVCHRNPDGVSDADSPDCKWTRAGTSCPLVCDAPYFPTSDWMCLPGNTWNSPSCETCSDPPCDAAHLGCAGTVATCGAAGCAHGYYSDGSTACQPCTDAFCTNCNATSVCAAGECADGYYTNGTGLCQPCSMTSCAGGVLTPCKNADYDMSACGCTAGEFHLNPSGPSDSCRACAMTSCVGGLLTECNGTGSSDVSTCTCGAGEYHTNPAGPEDGCAACAVTSCGGGLLTECTGTGSSDTSLCTCGAGEYHTNPAGPEDGCAACSIGCVNCTALGLTLGDVCMQCNATAGYYDNNGDAPEGICAEECADGYSATTLTSDFACTTVEASALPAIVVLSCEPVVSVLTPGPNDTLVVRGAHMSAGARVLVAGVEVPVISREANVLSIANPGKAEEGYLSIRVTNPRGITSPSSYEHTTCAFYTDSDCILEGFWRDSRGNCAQCPTGGFCPGGGRVWPTAGYWSPDEWTKPVGCTIMEACPGAVLSDAASVVGGKLTARCNIELGYTGVACDSCSRGFYRDVNRCVSCGGSSQAVVILLFVVALVAIAVLAMVVAVASDRVLDQFVSLIIGVQPLIVVGRTGSAYLPETGFGAFCRGLFLNLSLMLFEIEFVKPGCSIGAFSFSKVYFGMLGVCGIAFVVFSVVCLIRGLVLYLYLHEDMSLDGFVRMMIPRLSRSVVILVCLVYLQVTTRTIQALHCVRIGDKQYLKVERSTECFSPDHLPVFILSLVVLITYVCGAPVYLFRIINGIKNNLQDPSYKARYGYLYRGIRKRLYFFRLLTFFCTFVLAIETAMATSPNVQFFSTIVVFFINFVLVGIFLPFTKTYLTVLSLLGGIAKSLQAIVFLVLMEGSAAVSKGGRLAYLITLICFTACGFLVVAATLLYKYHEGGLAPQATSDEDDKDNVDAKAKDPDAEFHAVFTMDAEVEEIWSQTMDPKMYDNPLEGQEAFEIDDMFDCDMHSHNMGSAMSAMSAMSVMSALETTDWDTDEVLETGAGTSVSFSPSATIDEYSTYAPTRTHTKFNHDVARTIGGRRQHRKNKRSVTDPELHCSTIFEGNEVNAL